MSKSLIARTSILCQLLVLLGLNCPATVLYWDPFGISSTTSPAGTWTGGAQWSTGSAQTASLSAWSFGAAACFSAGSSATGTYTVTVTNVQDIGGIYNGSLVPPGCFLTLGGTGSFFMISGQDAISTGGSDGGTTTLLVPMSGPGQVVFEGGNQVYLNATNTYTGGTQFGYSGSAFTGTVNFNNGGAFGTGVMTMYSNGGNLTVAGSLPVTIPNSWIAAAVSMNIVGNPAGLTLSGGWNVSLTPSIGSGGAGNLVIISGVMAGSGGLNKWNNGILKLNAGNTYLGPTTITNGTLALGPSGSFNSSSSLTISAGSIFDVSANGAYTMGGSTTTLIAAGTGTAAATAAAINGAAGGTVNLGVHPIILNWTPASFVGDSAHPALYVSQGGLKLNGNSVTITNLAATPLGAGTYRLIQVGNGINGVLSGIPNSTFSLKGTGLATNLVASLSVTNGNLNLVVSPTPVFSNLTTADAVDPGIGVTNVTLSGTVAAAGPVYPGSGEVITVVINGKSMTTRIADSTGDFSVNFDPAAITFSTNLYPQVLSYGGDTALSAVTSSNNLTANAFFTGDALPGFFSGMNLFFTNRAGITNYAWSSTNAGSPVADWYLEGVMFEQPLQNGSGNSRYSITVNPAAPQVYYLLGPSVLWPYAATTAVQWIDTDDQGNYTFFATNTTMTFRGVLGIPSPIVLVQSPSSPTVLAGQNAYFSVAATGSSAQYQWFFNTNSLLPGMTNSTLVLTNVSTNLAGVYSVQVSNQFGAVASAPASLTVLPVPGLTAVSVPGGFQWSCTALPGETCWVQSATSLSAPIAWVTIATNQADANGLVQFSDMGVASTPTRFYRLVFR